MNKTIKSITIVIYEYSIVQYDTVLGQVSVSFQVDSMLDAGDPNLSFIVP